MKQIWLCGACFERVHWKKGKEGKTLAHEHECFTFDIDPILVRIPDKNEIAIIVPKEPLMVIIEELLEQRA